MIFRSTNGSVSHFLVCVWYTEERTKMQAGPSGNARDESRKAERRKAKNCSPRHNYLVGGAWLLGYLAQCLAGMLVECYSVLRPICELCAKVWYAIVSAMLPSASASAKCQVPYHLSL